MFSIVLVEPEIPQNTGNISRTCACTGAALHLVKPLGFVLDDAKLKRAGLDYWRELDLHIHESLADFLDYAKNKPLFFASTKAEKTYDEARFTLELDALDRIIRTTSCSKKNGCQCSNLTRLRKIRFHCVTPFKMICHAGVKEIHGK